MDNIENQVKEVIAEYFEVDVSTVVNDMKLADLGADSLDAVEIVLQLEEKFSLTVPDEENEIVETVQDVIDSVLKYLPTAA
jgi:acyl carrier protein